MEIAASSIAFVQAGVGTGKAIVRAIRMWEQVKQLPNDLRARLKRLESLEPMLRHIESDFAKYPELRFHPTAQQCLAYAMEVEATMKSHVEKLEGKIQKPSSNFRKRVNSLKIITLKKEEISMLESELAWAMESLQLAITYFHMAKTEISEQLVIKQTSDRIREFSIACQEDVVKKTAQAVANMIKIREEVDTEVVDAGSEKVLPAPPKRKPTMVMKSGAFGRYSFQRSRSNEGWTASLQIPWSQSDSSAVFETVRNGDLKRLVNLFKTGEATPFDRNESGKSLLYVAAKYERLEVCQVLIQQGVLADDERESYGGTPIDVIVRSRTNFKRKDDANHRAIVSLFRNAAQSTLTLTLERLFTFMAEYTYGDEYIRVYYSKFLTDYQTRFSLSDRLEAVRLAAFIVREDTTYLNLLSSDHTISPSDVEKSDEYGFSLLHSAAIATGIRLADELQFDRRILRQRTYTSAWSDVIIKTLRSLPNTMSLCHVETVVPWDWFVVPVWKATPLISLLGGALCRVSPHLPLEEWDDVFQAVLKQWLRDLVSAGVDLLTYGEQESETMRTAHPEVKGAFDSDAINLSRKVVRNPLQACSEPGWMTKVERAFDRSDRYWKPVRIISLDYGPDVDDWRVHWVVEVEAFAGGQELTPRLRHPRAPQGSKLPSRPSAGQIGSLQPLLAPALSKDTRSGITHQARLLSVSISALILSCPASHGSLFKAMASGDTRPPGKQGEWYLGDPSKLREQLDDFLSDVPDQIEDHGLPVPGARVIIAPHAGYTYSGATAAWAYKALDLSKAKRVFLLGPSHTFYLAGCAVSEYQNYGTPWGDLKVDEEVTGRLIDELEIPGIPRSNDKKEHSLEMHLPYLWVRLEQTFGSPENFPPVVPILIGDNNKAEEKEVGKWLAEYIKDPENAFIVSSDFCHWGGHFDYTIYCPGGTLDSRERLYEYGPKPDGPPIHETIKMVDDMAIEAIKTGKHSSFYDNLKQTKNTVCGRHPIGVTMAALEELGDHRFTFIQYNRSTLVTRPRDSSVSYVSAYAVV
ncbi:hypothetical protein CLIM01_08086 [Colletotrichum limetticola]|uniref:Memo-like protein n=1 Tax=Colletotrichum limetticola TaxID=1209924 RepID=A0ABQ9PSR7_9PEZI|nr:hypothetical protein CLIM01_08086 [Colletotrichum limetticola]